MTSHLDRLTRREFFLKAGKTGAIGGGALWLAERELLHPRRALAAMPQENYNDPGEFGKALAQHAIDQARKQSGGRDPSAPVKFDAKVTVTKTNPWSICISIGVVTVCYYSQ